MLKTLRKWLKNFKCKCKSYLCKTEASCRIGKDKENDINFNRNYEREYLNKKPLDKYLN